MAIVIKYRPLLHARPWIQKAPHINATAYSGGPMRSMRTFDQRMYHLVSQASMCVYNPFNDGWANCVAPALGTFAVGACAEGSAIGPSGTATAGSTTTLNTNLTIVSDLRGYEILITGGPGAGDVRTIASNSIGANSVITVSSGTPFSAAITAATTYTLRTGSLYLFGAGTLGATSFRKYDYATATLSNLSITGLPASWGTDGHLIGTPSIISRGLVTSNATGQANAVGGASTLINTTKTWATNQWANAFQIRITGGTGAGQTRIIASNTATVITTATAWTTVPDATSTYSIEGNDDYLWLIGNNVVTLYRYQIGTNTWTTVTPAVARASAPGAGCMSWHASQLPDAAWAAENAITNGRRIYSFRGASSNILDYFDIPSLSWVTLAGPGVGLIFPTNGWKMQPYQGKAYIRNLATGIQTSQWFVYDPVTNIVEPWATQPVLNAQTASYNSAGTAEFVDGTDVIPFLYSLVESSTINSPWLRTPIL